MFIQNHTLSIWKAGLIGGAVSVVANLALLYIGMLFVAAPSDFAALSPIPVIMWSVIGAVGAAGVYGAMRRWWGMSNRAFINVSAVVLLLSFIPDVMVLPVVGWGGAILLMLMHVVEALIVVYALTKWTR